jgi:reactive intermediate/imine deaminase
VETAVVEWRETPNMEKTPINPWTWQERAGFSQAWSVTGAEKLLYISGQAAISAEGQIVGEGDFHAQAVQVFENLQTVLDEAGAAFDAIVKISVYLTDMSNLMEFGQVKAAYIHGTQPASTAIGVSALALPGLMLEVEAIAVV